MIKSTQIIILEIAKELIWLCISVVIALALMYPIMRLLHYNMVWLNGLFLIVGLTYFRYAIMLRSVYVLRNRWVRAALLLFNINFFVFVLRQEQRFMTIYDSYNMEDLGKPITKISLEQANQLMVYFYNEINFTVVACLAMTAALSVRFVLSYWKTAMLRLNAGNEE